MNTQATSTPSLPSLLIRLEGLAVALAAGAAYAYLHADGLLFALLFFAPDAFMLGYIGNKQLGSVLYNIGHTYLLPGTLLALGLALNVSVVVQIALIWIAHIGFDRVVGYGLKYATAFKDTHLQRL